MRDRLDRAMATGWRGATLIVASIAALAGVVTIFSVIPELTDRLALHPLQDVALTIVLMAAAMRAVMPSVIDGVEVLRR